MTKGAERTRWKIRSDRLVDETPQVRLSIASLELASGLTFEQYVMRLPRCAMTVVLDDSAERILLIWRHRFIIDRWIWELPGGYIDPGEDGIVAAAREVEEETGYWPRSIEPILTFQPMTGSADSAVSGLGGAIYDGAARAAGLRWVSPDKPGYGGSDYQRKRSVSGWGDDLAVLAGRLGLDQFALAGESGGAPFTLAAAHQLAGRVSVVALIASGGPIGPAERAGQRARNRIMGWLARNAPALNTIQAAAIRRELANPARRERSLRRDMAAAPEAAHAALRIEYEAVADALRQGTRATVQELALIKRPWAFPLSEVKTPVHLWHGELDRNAPIAFARRLARELPDATLHVGDSSGHDIGHDHSDEIMSVLASHVK